MVFYILIAIVFLAELIILWFFISNLIKTNRNICEANSLLNETKPQIKEIAQLGRKISEQIKELAPSVEDKIKEKLWDFGIKNFKGILITTLLWAVKKKYDIKISPLISTLI